MPKYSLDNVTIDGFRGLRKLRLDDLGLFNILVGANNSGKTSVLEALSILCNPLQPFEWISMVRRRDFGQLDETRVQSLRWCFPQNGQLADPETMFEGECTMSCDGRFPLRKLRVTYTDIVGEPDLEKARSQARLRGMEGEEIADDQPRRGAVIKHFIDPEVSPPRLARVDEEIRIAQVWEDQPFTTRLPLVEGDWIPTETLTPYSYQINRVQVRSQSRSLFDDHRSLVLDLIRQFDPDVEKIEVASFRGGRPAIYLGHRRLGPAPLSVFGDSLRRAVLLAGTLPTLKDNGILFIDEIEAGIHVRALKRVATWLTKAARDLRVQIVATTHSLEAVDAIALATEDQHQLDDLVTFRLEQTEQETRAKRIYGDLLLGIRRDQGWDVR
jgi:energy-coupling factor transporter ATP-binding protein EcfA2